MPSPGRITRLRLPQGPGVRDDGGVYASAEVSIYYDPMISKLAAWGRTRAEAIDRLRRALDEYEVGGIRTTLPFFREIVRDQEFIEGRLDTGFIPRFFARRAGQSDTEKRRSGEAETDATETVTRDLAIITAALARDVRERSSSNDGTTQQQSSAWKLKGRAAQQRSRDLF
jgi:acetyl-CoA carboxylase biotin carboxylase subunit